MEYQLLPFRFERFNDTEYLLTNEVGEYIFLQNEDFHRFVNGEMDIHSDLFMTLNRNKLPRLTKLKMWFRCLQQNFAQRKAYFVTSPLYIWSYLLCVAIPVAYIVKSHAKIGMTTLPT